MKTKKTVIAVLTVVLLISAALIVGCIGQFDQSDVLSAKDAEDNDQIPAGKGVIKIKFVDSNAKTILPVASLTSYTYDLLIQNTGGTVTVVNQTGLSYTDFTTGSYKSIALAPRTDYTISLTAFDGTVAVGAWNNNGGATFSISTGLPTNLTAALKPYDTTGQGTFSFDISPATNGTTVFDVFLSNGITSIGTSYWGHTSQGHLLETESFPMTIASDNTTGTITLASGYYLVKVTATDTNSQTIQYIHALHIYQGMDSSLEQDLSGITLAIDRFTVTYHLTQADTANGYVNNGTDTVYYANFITKKGAGATAGQPVFASDSFAGWWTTADYEVSGTLINLDALRVTGNLDLYAKAAAAGGDGSLELAITFPINEQAVVTGTTSIAKSALVGGTSIVLTAPSDVTVTKWSIGGDTISGTHVTNASGGTNNVLTINNSVTFLKYLAGSTFVVNFESTKDSKLYSASIDITLTGSLP